MENLDESLNLDQKYEYEYGGEQEISQPVVYPKEVDIGNLRRRTILLLFDSFKKFFSSLYHKTTASNDA